MLPVALLLHYTVAMAAARRAHQIFLMMIAAALLFPLLLASPWPLVSARNIIKHLPGFNGPLPFYLETGYVQVDDSNDVQLFYYFIKSERKPEDDPLILWMTGGPGCSALSGLLYEIGPLEVDLVGYTEGLPSLLYSPISWTQVSNIIFLDSPVGTGFSYSSTKKGAQTSDYKSSHDTYRFLKKWYVEHPEFLRNPLYLGGDSYSGMVVPVIAQYIVEGNEVGDNMFLNLKGYFVGNPVTDTKFDTDALVPYVHGMGLISEELYELTMKSCGGEFLNPTNVQCQNNLEAVYQNLDGINIAHILEPICFLASPKPSINAAYRRKTEEVEVFHLFKTHLPLWCRSSGYLLSYYWANNDLVREALGIHKGTVEYWSRCSQGLNYSFDVHSTIKYHLSLTSKGYRALAYSGDHDMVVPFLATQAWIKSLNYSIVDDWRPWFVDGQVAGFTRTYANNLTFATVKGGGHTAPEYRPKECLAMLERWLSGDPL